MKFLKYLAILVQVHYNGICYRLRVKPGPEGFASFNRQLQRITGLPVLDCMQITFQCRAPESSQELSFKGITAFDAGEASMAPWRRGSCGIDEQQSYHTILWLTKYSS